MFGNKEEKRAQDAAAEAEVERLTALPVEDLAAEILPAFGPDGPGKGERSINILQIASFMVRTFPRGASHIRPLLEPLREGVQRLEHSELVRTQLKSTGGGRTVITRRGLEAVASGKVREYVGSPGLTAADSKRNA
ncbi:MAG TPA: hypothetical protein VMU39_13325 [Solirubrobacteraceae bacterium]|nr:hypothetical protein [Solirubrobacteraceae bacterium]